MGDAERAAQEEQFDTFGLVLDLREEAARMGAKLYAGWLIVKGGEEGDTRGRAIYDHISRAEKLLGVDDEAALRARLQEDDGA